MKAVVKDENTCSLEENFDALQLASSKHESTQEVVFVKGASVVKVKSKLIVFSQPLTMGWQCGWHNHMKKSIVS